MLGREGVLVLDCAKILAPNGGPKVWHTITGEAASTMFKDVSQEQSRNVEKDRERKKGNAAKVNQRRSKQKSNDNSLPPCSHTTV